MAGPETTPLMTRQGWELATPVSMALIATCAFAFGIWGLVAAAGLVGAGAGVAAWRKRTPRPKRDSKNKKASRQQAGRAGERRPGLLSRIRSAAVPMGRTTGSSSGGSRTARGGSGRRGGLGRALGSLRGGAGRSASSRSPSRSGAARRSAGGGRRAAGGLGRSLSRGRSSASKPSVATKGSRGTTSGRSAGKSGWGSLFGAGRKAASRAAGGSRRGGSSSGGRSGKPTSLGGLLGGSSRKGPTAAKGAATSTKPGAPLWSSPRKQRQLGSSSTPQATQKERRRFSRGRTAQERHDPDHGGHKSKARQRFGWGRPSWWKARGWKTNPMSWSATAGRKATITNLGKPQPSSTVAMLAIENALGTTEASGRRPATTKPVSPLALTAGALIVPSTPMLFVPGGAGMARNPHAALIEAAAQSARTYSPDNALRVIEWYDGMPEMIDAVAQMLAIQGDRTTTEFYLYPAAAEFARALGNTFRTYKDPCEAAKQAFWRAHRDDLERVLHPRPNQERWDITLNKD